MQFKVCKMETLSDRHKLSPDYVLAALNKAESIMDWHQIRNQIMLDNGGRLPLFWQRVVVRSGFMDNVAKRWGLQSEMGGLSAESFDRVKSVLSAI